MSKTTKQNSEKQNVKKLVFRKAPSYGHSVVQCAALTMPFMNRINNGGSQYPLHMSQVFVCSFVANGLSCYESLEVAPFFILHFIFLRDCLFT